MRCKLDPALQPNSRFQASRIQFRFSRPTKNSAPLSDPDMETQQYHAIPCIMAPQLCQKQSKTCQKLGLLCLGQGYLSYYPILSDPIPSIHSSIYLSMHLSIGCTYLYIPIYPSTFAGFILLSIHPCIHLCLHGHTRLCPKTSTRDPDADFEACHVLVVLHMHCMVHMLSCYVVCLRSPCSTCSGPWHTTCRAIQPELACPKR